MSQENTLFKYSKESLESKINEEEQIKMKRKQFKPVLELVKNLYFPDDKTTIQRKIHKKTGKVTEEEVPLYEDLKSFKCIINKDTKTLKCIIIEYGKFYNNYFCGGEGLDGMPLKGYDSGYSKIEIRIYNNKIYNDNNLIQTGNIECIKMFQTVKQEINKIFQKNVFISHKRLF